MEGDTLGSFLRLSHKFFLHIFLLLWNLMALEKFSVYILISYVTFFKNCIYWIVRISLYV